MTIDERLEALTQSLELMARMQQDTERQNDRRWAETRAEFDRRWVETDRRFAETLQFINQLARVAEVHEQRLDHLEGQ